MSHRRKEKDERNKERKAKQERTERLLQQRMKDATIPKVEVIQTRPRAGKSAITTALALAVMAEEAQRAKGARGE
jgi:hypothetical protein